MSIPLTGSMEALFALFEPRHMFHGPIFQETRKSRRAARLARKDNYQRALWRGLVGRKSDEEMKNGK